MDIKKMQAAFEAQEQQATPKSTNISTQDFSLRNQKPGDNVIVRFIPDGNTENPWFWAARSTHTLMFRGLKNDPSNADSTVVVTLPGYNRTVDKTGRLVQASDGNRNKNNLPLPSEEYVYTNKEDPIQMYSSENNLFNNPDIKDPYDASRTLSEAIKRRVTYLMQGFVVECPSTVRIENNQEIPFEGSNVSPRLLRHFTFGQDVFDRISVETRDLVKEEIDPTHYVSGYNFIIEASKQGQYISRGASRFERRPSQITVEQANDLKINGIDRLEDRLFKKPTAEQLNVIKEIFAAYLAGQPFDPEWGKTYPYRVNKNTRRTNQPVQTETTVENVQTPVVDSTIVSTAAPSNISNDLDVMQILQNTQNTQKAEPVVEHKEEVRQIAANDLLAILASGTLQ